MTEEVFAAYVLNGFFSHSSEDAITEKIVEYMMEGKNVYCIQTPALESCKQSDAEQLSHRAHEAPNSPSHTHVNVNVGASTSVQSNGIREYIIKRLSQMEANLEIRLSKSEVNIETRLTKIEDTLQIILDYISEQHNLFARKRKRNESLSTDTPLQQSSSRYMDTGDVHQSNGIFEHIQKTSTLQIDNDDVLRSEGKPCPEIAEQLDLMIPSSPKRVVKKSKFLSTPFTTEPSTTPTIVMKFNPFLGWFDNKAYKNDIKQLKLDLKIMEENTMKKGMCGDYNKLWLNKFGECGVCAIKKAALELSDMNVLTLNDDIVADFRKSSNGLSLSLHGLQSRYAMLSPLKKHRSLSMVCSSVKWLGFEIYALALNI
ncbi:uncharacterized protein [Henckelia pumila]|uniref:uncharacterized protein n=1 Tax=Henckelia pumila TaxID=405737 RepID=UPI003C6E1B1D